MRVRPPAAGAGKLYAREAAEQMLVPRENRSQTSDSTTRKIPDARWINSHLNISEVARALGVRSAGPNRFHCWRPQNHRNGDSDASVFVWKPANRLKCFGNGCDRPPVGPIDLVMELQDMDFRDAVAWIAKRFNVPTIAKASHLRLDTPPQVGRAEGPMEFLVRSGIFAS